MIFKVPADVSAEKETKYLSTLERITYGTGRLFVFAGDQKAEHLNKDFYGDDIAQEDAEPEHLFQIATKSKIGVFATQLGLIAQYGKDYSNIPYLVKLNSKTDIINTSQQDPKSLAWTSVSDVVKFEKSSRLNISGVGYTIYPGSEFESEMFAEASEIVNDAHHEGYIAIIWAYPRGKAVKDERDPHLIAGVAGLVATMGADYVKINPPKTQVGSSAEAIREAVLAAGRTKVICAGGPSTDTRQFLKELYDQIHIGGASGNATGRNIHQKSLPEAVRFCDAINAITIDNKSVDDAMTFA
jgi:fructose-bisphosphate aldolase / 6-deoxy-5-ketofructose 1-phosphate synthase